MRHPSPAHAMLIIISTAVSPAAPSGAAAPPPSRRRFVVPTLLTLATIVGFFACFAVWVNRQALNTDNWTDTSGRVLENRQVQEALSVYLVNQLFASTNVAGRIETALPSELQGLSGPLAAGLRQLADRVVPQLLATTQVQELWRRANRTAHAELMRILNGGGNVVSTREGTVTLNLHELVTQLGTQLGIGNQVAAARKKLSGGGSASVRRSAEQSLGVALPESSGRITIMRARQLRAAQNIATAIRGLAIVLPLLGIALFALAVWLARGRRRVTLRTTGWCFFGIGVTLLLTRRVAGERIVDGLVVVPANRPAADAVWSIGTSLLYETATAMLLYGIVLVAAAWLVGTTRPAMFLRREAAPWLREHAVGSYAVGGVALVIVVLWGPTPATRKLLPVLGFAALTAFGIAMLKRHTASEFPDAMPGEALASLRGRMRFVRAPSAPPAAAAADTGPQRGEPQPGEPQPWEPQARAGRRSAPG